MIGNLMPVTPLEIVIFEVEDDRYGIPVDRVVEVNRELVVTKVPGAGPAVRGAANLRGQIVTVLDIRRILGFPEFPEDMIGTVLIAYSRNELVGILVDSIVDVLQFDRQNIEPPPANLPMEKADRLVGVIKDSEGLISLIDLDIALD
jgi:purine-binding chemotaxis protein CheW